MASYNVHTVGEHIIRVEFDREDSGTPVTGECYGCTTRFDKVRHHPKPPIEAVIDWANDHAARCRFTPR
jgi:hypothetical protein